MRNWNVLAIMGLAAMSAQAGEVLQVSTRDLPSGKPAPSEVYYVQDGMMRIDQLNAAGTITNVQLVRDNMIWDVDPRGRTFTRVDAETMKGFVGGQTEQMQAMIANMPPERQAMMKARLAQMQQRNGATSYSYSDLGRSDQSGQYSCRVWSEQRSGKPYAEYCVVSSSSLPGGADLAAGMKKALDTVGTITSGVPQLENSAEHLTRMGKMNGFPVRQRFLSSTGQPERELLLVSVETQALPADKFAVPQGFTEKPLGGRSGD